MHASLAVWLVTVAIGQGPAEDAWLAAMPSDVDVAVRFRGIDASRERVVAMLRAMSPTLAAQAEPLLDEQVNQLRTNFGDNAATHGWTALIRVAPVGGDGSPQFVVVVPGGDYETVLKGLTKGEPPKLAAQPDGYDIVENARTGSAVYAVKRQGFMAFGPDRVVVAGLAKPGERSLGAGLSPLLRRAFHAGDFGLLVNAKALVSRYDESIQQGRQAFLDAIDQAGRQAGNARSMEFVKEMYGGMFDRVSDAEALAMGMETAPDGLHLSGAIAFRAGTESFRAVAESRVGNGEDLANLPAGNAFYTYMNLDAKTLDQLQGMSLRMLNPEGKATAEQAKALLALHALGQVETAGSARFGAGLRVFNVIRVADPAKFIAVSIDVLKSMAGGEGSSGFYKDVVVEPKAASHAGFEFTRVTATIDLARLEQLAGNDKSTLAPMKAMFADGKLVTWFGTDGKRVVQGITPGLDEVQSQLEAFLKGGGGVGSVPGFAAARKKLAPAASMSILLSAQGLVEMFASQFSAIAEGANMKVPDDMPREPAFLGGSVTPSAPGAHEFHFVLPSAVGPIIEKGLVPVFQSMRAARP